MWIHPWDLYSLYSKFSAETISEGQQSSSGCQFGKNETGAPNGCGDEPGATPGNTGERHENRHAGASVGAQERRNWGGSAAKSRGCLPWYVIYWS